MKTPKTKTSELVVI